MVNIKYSLSYAKKDVMTRRNRCICLHAKAEEIQQRQVLICTRTHPQVHRRSCTEEHTHASTPTNPHTRTQTHAHTRTNTKTQNKQTNLRCIPHRLPSCDSVVMSGPSGHCSACRLRRLRPDVSCLCPLCSSFVCGANSFQSGDSTCKCLLFFDRIYTIYVCCSHKR